MKVSGPSSNQTGGLVGPLLGAPGSGLALLLGLFLGLTLWKFGNPVILDHKLETPGGLLQAWSQPWPVRWAHILGIPLVLTWVLLLVRGNAAHRSRSDAWARIWKCLPGGLACGWLLWNGLSATGTTDAALTAATLPQLLGCVLAFFIGGWVRPSGRWHAVFAVGLGAALALVLVRAANQHLFEFRQDYAAMLEGPRTGWKDFPQEALVQMERDGLLVRTNQILVPSEMLMTKLKNGRAYGTMVYPNALAGLVLLLGPAALWLAIRGTGGMKPLVHWCVSGLAGFLVLGSLYWTGSRSGWLLALGQGMLGLWAIPGSRQRKVGILLAVCLAGGVGFVVRNREYFKRGATSVSARGDYWRAAWDTARENPVTGTGPGTFYRSYAQRKKPESEMARLTHNDYLQQACDSGWPGAAFYLGWVATSLWRARRNVESPVDRWVWIGLMGWFAQGLSEFGLYIPALAWSAFALLGAMALGGKSGTLPDK